MNQLFKNIQDLLESTGDSASLFLSMLAFTGPRNMTWDAQTRFKRFSNCPNMTRTQKQTTRGQGVEEEHSFLGLVLEDLVNLHQLLNVLPPTCLRAFKMLPELGAPRPLHFVDRVRENLGGIVRKMKQAL